VFGAHISGVQNNTRRTRPVDPVKTQVGPTGPRGVFRTKRIGETKTKEPGGASSTYFFEGVSKVGRAGEYMAPAKKKNRRGIEPFGPQNPRLRGQLKRKTRGHEERKTKKIGPGCQRSKYRFEGEA